MNVRACGFSCWLCSLKGEKRERNLAPSPFLRQLVSVFSAVFTRALLESAAENKVVHVHFV